MVTRGITCDELAGIQTERSKRLTSRFIAEYSDVRTADDRLTVKSSRGDWKAYLIWAWMLATFANFRVRSLTDLTSGETFDAQVLFQVGSWLCFGVIAARALLRGKADLTLARRGPLAYYTGFVVVAFVSASYSPLPALSAFTAFQHGVALVLVISLGDRLRNLFPFALIYLSVNWIIVILGALHLTFGTSWVTPPDGSQMWTDEEGWRFASAFGHPSQIAIVAAAAAFMKPAKIRTSFGRFALTTLDVLTLLLTISRTAIAGFIAGLLFVLARRRRLIIGLCVSGSIVTLGVLIEPSRDLMWSYVSRRQSHEEIASLTGRMPVYEDAISRVKEHWAFGQGFLSTRVLLLNDEGNGNGTVHPHNMALAALLGMGIGGAIFAVGSILSFAWAGLKLLRVARTHPDLRDEATSCAATILPIAAFCVLDAGFVTKVDTFILLYLAAAARTLSVLNIKKIRAQQHTQFPAPGLEQHQSTHYTYGTNNSVNAGL